ncbi:SPW_0924 family protein [Streptomyces sp. NPDC002519]
MRALDAAALGLALVFALTALGSSSGSTSPKPLLTTVPSHP